MKKVWKNISFVLPVMLFSFFINGITASANVQDALGESGITGAGDASGFFDDLNNVMYFIIALAGFWIIGCIIFAGAKLSASGGNAQNRTAAFISLGLALIGAFVIYKSYEIAGWATGIGS